MRSASLLVLLSWVFTLSAGDSLHFGALDPAVGSVTVTSDNNLYGMPVININGDGTLRLTFDILEPERRYLRYSLRHCDTSWRPDMLQPIEYASGFNEGRIDDYAYSRGTLTQYVNYSVSLPNDEVTPLVSGNYLLTVYDEDKPDMALLRVPFMVTENSTRLAATVTGRTDFDYNGSHQQLSVSVDFNGLDINDPWSELILVVIPDSRLNAAQMTDRPMKINGKGAVYSNVPTLTFTAGNEYRRFETVSTSRYLPMGVELVAYDEPWYHFKLYDDIPRADKPYSYDQTQFGHFTVNADDVDDPDTESEYVKVHFSLDIPEQPDVSVVIEGDLTGRRTDPLSPGTMIYNRVSGRYEKVLTLKQGSYNYQYLIVTPDGKTLTEPIEGDDYRTANHYDIAVYYRQRGARYDRLIGFTSIISGT